MFHKVKFVRPLADYKLLAQFAEGAVREYAVKPLFEKWPAFRD